MDEEDIYTFKSECNKFQFSVKRTFLRKVHKPEIHSVYDLMAVYGMASYLHNTSAPAIIHLESGLVEYWMNGKSSNVEVAKFNHKFLDMLEE